MAAMTKFSMLYVDENWQASSQELIHDWSLHTPSQLEGVPWSKIFDQKYDR